MDKDLEFDFKKLNKFVKCLSTDMVVQVGIFGKKNDRKDSEGMTNAEVGFIHEFGQPPHIPRRSFLRMPIYQSVDIILSQVKKAGALKKLADGKMIQVLADLGIACEIAIQNAFASGGWGDWKPNRPFTIEKKGSSAPLIDTGQLRRSIASAVVNS
jgi:phage gpG-like protein